MYFFPILFYFFFRQHLVFDLIGVKEKWLADQNFLLEVLLPIFNNYIGLNLLHPWLIGVPGEWVFWLLFFPRMLSLNICFGNFYLMYLCKCKIELYFDNLKMVEGYWVLIWQFEVLLILFGKQNTNIKYGSWFDHLSN